MENRRRGNAALKSQIGVALTLLLLGGTASASWVPFGIGNANFTNYVDHGTIVRNGNTVRMWNLVDFKKTNSIAGKSVLSMKMEREYDCQKDQSRDIFLSFHSKNMGEGEMLSSQKFSDAAWVPNPPGKADEAVWKDACGKK